MAKKSEELMLDKETIMKAIEESQRIKVEYPSFWKFYEMLLEMNNGLSALQDAMEDKGNNKKK